MFNFGKGGVTTLVVFCIVLFSLFDREGSLRPQCECVCVV